VARQLSVLQDVADPSRPHRPNNNRVGEVACLVSGLLLVELYLLDVEEGRIFVIL
jgi:hypothetical protein